MPAWRSRFFVSQMSRSKSATPRLLAVEPRHQAQREAEITWSDVDPVDARDIEDSFEIVERLLSLDHGDDQDFVIGGLLVLTGAPYAPARIGPLLRVPFGG